MNCAAGKTIIVIQMSSWAIVDNVLVDAVVTTFKLSIEAGLLLPDTELMAEIKCDCIIAKREGEVERSELHAVNLLHQTIHAPAPSTLRHPTVVGLHLFHPCQNQVACPYQHP